MARDFRIDSRSGYAVANLTFYYFEFCELLADCLGGLRDELSSELPIGSP